MKAFIIISAILLVAGIFPGTSADKKKIMAECKTEAGITDELKQKPPNMEDPKVKCWITCMKTKFGIIEDGKVSADKLIEKMSKKKDLDDATKENLKACAETANQQSGCEVGPALMKCLQEKGIKFGKGKPAGEPKGEGGEE